MDDLFRGRNVDWEIIILCVRWTLRFKSSFRYLVDMMAVCRTSLAHTTIRFRIARYVSEFEKRWTCFTCRAVASWRVDETYVKIKGRRTLLLSLSNHLSPAPQRGKDGRCPAPRQAECHCSRSVFRRAITGQGRLPSTITLDGCHVFHRTAREILGEDRCGKRTKILFSSHFNNLIEWDHRIIALRRSPMLGLKRFSAPRSPSPALNSRIGSGPLCGPGRQFRFGTLRIKDNRTPEISNAVLAA
jgi:transposase-like protein